MKNWIEIVGWIIFTFFAVLALLTVISFLNEKSWRACSRAITVFIPALAGFEIVLMTDFSAKGIVILAIMAAAVAFLFTLIIRWKKPDSIKFVGKQARIDERDALFHRFYRLKPGSREFEAYYHAHPEKIKIDDAIRSLPQLGNPGSKTYHPFVAPFHVAIFEVLEQMTRDLEWKPDPIESEKMNISSKEITERIKGFASYLGADLVGATKLNPAYVYSHIGRAPGNWGKAIELNHTHAIAIAIEMRHDMIRHAPESPTITESAFSYFENARIAMILAKYINLLGYEARAHVDGNYRVMCIPIAVDAGLGELGRLGLLITPKFGPRVRLSIVTTNLPLDVDQPISFGVQEFCSFCKKCAINCPSGSINSGEKKVYAGVEKWQSDQENCYRFWRKQGTDCAICVKVCPYSYPAAPMHNIVRWMVRRNHFARRLAFLGDAFFYGKRPKIHSSLPKWHNPDF
ncbi:reductive dehalogenase [candidate division KSB1 bacterium]|nr:reductive dehalogenase [candidate division KSB1 bacterium]